MFIGHFALGLSARKADKSPSLALIFIAVQFLDLIWPIFVLLGIESFQIEPGNTKMTPLNFTYYPYSHSLLMSIVWGIIFGLTYFVFTKNGRASILLFALVFSHWVLDFITHRPDLPLSPFSDVKVGLSLWNFPAIEIILEIGLFLLGTIWYYKSVKPRKKLAFWSLISMFLVIHILNLLSPPPPGISAVAWSANLMWLFVIWAWWIEKDIQRNS
ncbi:MAG TPA: hypothetical protein PKM97_04765 [Bacteroidia bacterium]|nr:hypothetical protein [Bacteroidia bacterium]